jgi:hypothetical protein
MLPGLMALREAEAGGQPLQWLQVTQRKMCEAMQDDFCLGRYGFTIRNDGAFTAGPSGRGRTVEGRIKRQELDHLGKLIDQLSLAGSDRRRIGDPHGVPGVRDQADIIFAGLPVTRVYDQGGTPGEIRYLGTWDAVRRFHQYLSKLLTRYYPMPFPTSDDGAVSEKPPRM